MSIVEVGQVTALVKTAADQSAIQDVIDREEAFLARELRAPLAGERTQRVWRSPFGSDFNPIYLMRPTDALAEVRDNGAVVDPTRLRLLEAGTVVELADAAWQGPDITLKYTPSDLPEVQRVIVELCRLTLIETGFNSENISGYSYQRAGVKPASAMQMQVASRRALVRSLLPRPRLGSFRLERVHLAERYTPVTPA